MIPDEEGKPLRVLWLSMVDRGCLSRRILCQGILGQYIIVILPGAR